MKNPFLISGYSGPVYFCDREEETGHIIRNIENGVNTTLLSIRRIGKTGLIRHVFYKIEDQKKAFCVYIDLYATQNMNDFMNEFATTLAKKFPEKKSIGKKLMHLLKGLRPLIQFNGLTGEPEISFEFTQESQITYSLQSLFAFLENQNIQIVIAFDEFQQINEYPEKNTEAVLRTIIQTLKNIQFIFSGSSKHLLIDIFNNSKRPFFASTQAIQLGFIPDDKYVPYIKAHFEQNKKEISEEAISFILKWTKSHTYYTQVVCNRVFSFPNKKIILQDVYRACNQLLKEQEIVFFQYRNLLTTGQWNVLKAIAKEGNVYQILEKRFVQKYNLGSTSSIQRSVAALVKKEMIYEEQEERGSFYAVYDCFLSRWLEK
ncbi:MAG: ATP-binding protein [Flavobacteriia bacterium]|nr:ATP-binding protein [Flavobacteriia bacterium]